MTTTLRSIYQILAWVSIILFVVFVNLVQAFPPLAIAYFALMSVQYPYSSVLALSTVLLLNQGTAFQNDWAHWRDVFGFVFSFDFFWPWFAVMLLCHIACLVLGLRPLLFGYTLYGRKIEN